MKFIYEYKTLLVLPSLSKSPLLQLGAERVAVGGCFGGEVPEHLGLYVCSGESCDVGGSGWRLNIIL